MNHPRRNSTKIAFQLEPLDERIAPAHLGLGAVHAAMAHHRAAILSRLEGHTHASHLQYHHAQASMISGDAHKFNGARFAYNATQHAAHNVLRSALGSDSPTPQPHAPAPTVSMATPVTPTVAGHRHPARYPFSRSHRPRSRSARQAICLQACPRMPATS